MNAPPRIKRHLEPLAVAANITQATQSRLDDVLMVLGFLYLQFTSLCDAEDGSAKEAVLASLDKRWAKADQSVFIAAVVLHPGLMISPFRKEGWNTRAGLYTVFGDLHKRFFPDDPIPPSLSQDIKDYLDNRGEFIKVHTYAASKASFLFTSQQQMFILVCRAEQQIVILGRSGTAPCMLATRPHSYVLRSGSSRYAPIPLLASAFSVPLATCSPSFAHVWEMRCFLAFPSSRCSSRMRKIKIKRFGNVFAVISVLGFIPLAQT